MRILGHGTVCGMAGVYCGWPANHGAWQWGRELLVGFLTGRHAPKSMHWCHEPFRKLLARSTDDGQSWRVEDPLVDFECELPQDRIPPQFTHLSAIRACGVYDHGGDACAPEGGFYFSNDRGHIWHGAHRFSGLEELLDPDNYHNTSRTAQLGDLLFLTRNHQSFATDETYCVRSLGDGGFMLVGTVCADEIRAAMPAVARAGERIVAVLRRRRYSVRDCWLDAFGSEDEGRSWRFLSCAATTGGHNGNPGALVALSDGRLVCAYANRSEARILAAVSEDRGSSWQHPPLMLREALTADIGYPRLFVVGAGQELLCVYYYAEREGVPQRIEWTRFEV